MAAKDYKICPALFNVYIARPSKAYPNEMTNDRRALDEEEILMIIDWYLDNQLDEIFKTLTFKSCYREGKKVQLQYIDDKET